MINHLKDLARWLYPKPTVNYLSDHRIVLITFPQWQEIEHDREHPTIDLTCIMLKSEDSEVPYYVREPLFTIVDEYQDYIMIGCWYINPKRKKSWNEYLSLVEFTASRIHPDLEDAKKTLDAIKPCATEKEEKIYLDWQQFHKLFTTWQWIGLQDLGLIEIIDGKIIYLY